MKNRKFATAVMCTLAVSAAPAGPVLAQEGAQSGGNGQAAPATPAAPCRTDEKFRQFDFWIGEWEVRDASGKLAGHNVIEPAHEGCALVENWTSVSGGTGMSLNYLDHDKDEWVQVWIDSGGGQIEIRGGLTDEGMLLTGQIHYTSNDSTAPFRGLWTPLPDGRVRQFFEQSNDGGKTWQTWFEGFYRRIDNES